MYYTDSLKILADDIRKTINQVFDDAKVTRTQVVFWIRIVANDLLGKHIAKRDSGAFVKVFDNIPVLISGSSSSNLSVVKQRKFFQLPKLIFDFDDDGGIDYLAYTSDGSAGCPPRFTQVTFSRTTPKESESLYYHPQTTPSPERPYFYRQENSIYLLGIEKVGVPYLEAGLKVTVDPLQEVNIDEPFRFPAELVDVLKMQVINMARYSFLFPDDSRKNLGDNDEEKAPGVQKIASVNPSNQPEQ